MTKRQDQIMAKLGTYAAELVAAEKTAERARKKLHEWIAKGVAEGVPTKDVARVAGVTRQRVTQLAPQNPVTEPRVHAQKKGAPALCVAPADTVPTIPGTAPTQSGVASVRRRDRYGRATVFHDTRVTDDLATILDEARFQHPDAKTVRVVLAGPAPTDDRAGSRAEGVRAWALGQVPGWTAQSHYLGDATLPVLRFQHAETGQRVTVIRGAAWWGESDASAETCAAAWAGLEVALEGVPAFAGTGLADTPATTGRALWLRTIPEGKSYPVLSDELRELIHSTSGQGRVELLGDPGGEHREFTYLDGRFMYSALTWGMPVGEPKMWTGDQVRALQGREYEKIMRGRGRWRITATVPATWNHVGMLMAPAADSRAWCYPSGPGERFTTWADGSEVWAAVTNGWAIETHEGITWDEGKPLDLWKESLLTVWRSAQASPEPAAQLAARAIRALVLFTIGAFATRAHPTTHTAPVDSPELVPAGVEVRVVGESLVWETPGTMSAWSMETAHPEWSATIWARARTRLLTGRGVNKQQVGALHLPRERIVSFATDALYLAGGAPDWADDGQPGRFRTKGTRPGDFVWPASYQDLHQLRDAAERGQ